MSRLTDLIAQVKAKDPQVGDDLEAEFKALSKRRAFGLNFERHKPEEVELPGRPVRRGDRVRVLPERGTTGPADQRLWTVTKTHRADGERVAHLRLVGSDPIEEQVALVEDLVVIAGFGDAIYPGLVETGRVERGEADDPFHTVINAENYHALRTLTYTHRGKIDCIYIDPPYNTGDKSWKYNNNYVEGDDLYRHSKWLAFMERRLRVARELLNPEDSVLIITIDEKEYLRLGLLLEQTFPEAKVQMVTIVINPLGQERASRLARVEEYAFFVFFGGASPRKSFDDLLNEVVASDEVEQSVRWERLIRGGTGATRRKSPDLFFPVFIDEEVGRIVEIGEPLERDADRSTVKARPGLTTVWPLRRNGSEGRWRCSPSYLRSLLSRGYARLGTYDKSAKQWTISYLGKAQIDRIEKGAIEIVARANAGHVILGSVKGAPNRASIKTVWNRPSHRAGEYGTALNGDLMPGRPFDYPKSLYAVEDALRIAVGDKPNATVLDFFSGSGTTAHAVMRLNRQDDGRRRSISVTNNEVSADEHKTLRKQGLRPGDHDWEALGICDYITKPRIIAAITGHTHQGQPVRGAYKFTDEFPMSDGFATNARFFTLTYETPISVSHNRAFARIAPLLWLRAGATGQEISTLPEAGWEVADTYALLSDLDAEGVFLKALEDCEGLRIAYIVTDDAGRFESASSRLPDGIEPVRLYESYLTNLSFLSGD